MFDFLFKLTPAEVVKTLEGLLFTSTPTEAEEIVSATLPVVQPVVQYVNSTLPFNPFGAAQDICETPDLSDVCKALEKASASTISDVIATLPTSETASALIGNTTAVIDNAETLIGNVTAVVDNAETLIGNATAVIGQASSPTILEMCSAAASNISDKALELTPTAGYGAAIIAGAAAALKVGQVAYDRYRKPAAVTNVASDAKVDVDPAVRDYVEAMFKSEAHEAILQMPSDILEAIVEDDAAFSDFIENADKEQLDALSHLKSLEDFNAFLAFNPEQKSAFLKALSEDNKKQASPRLK